MSMRSALHAAYIALLALLTSLGVTAEFWFSGFAAAGKSGPFYCHDLMSSGGDDDVMIRGLIAFVMPLVLRLLRRKQRISGYELGLFGLSAAIVWAALLLASLDCAEIFYTAFLLPELLFACGLLAMPVAAVTLWLLWRAHEVSKADAKS